MATPYVFPASLRPEIEAALRDVLKRYRAGKVASFMISQDATGSVNVHLIDCPSPEEWRSVEGWPYEVSDRGQVRRTAHGTTAGKILQEKA